MVPVVESIVVARPREEVYDYLVDIANHAEFCDHFLEQFRLTREDPVGLGAGARFKIAAPGNRFGWGDATFVECERPYRIVETGRMGKFNRVRTLTTYTLTPAPGGQTKVELSTETQPATLSDRIMESFGARRWVARQYRRALRRLRAILEEGEERGQRATVAGLDRV